MSRKWSSNTVVACYTLDGQLIRTYRSAKDASRCRNLHPRTIDKCIRGDVLTVKGQQWKRFPVNEVPTSIPPLEKEEVTTSNKPVAKLDEKGNIVEVYPSIKNAAKENNLDAHSLRDQVNEKYKYLGKTKFRYLTDEEIEKYNFKIIGEIRVRQYSFSGRLIKVHESVMKAAKKVGIHHSSIQQCLKGKIKTAGGYFWVKDDERAEQALTELMSSKKFFYTTIIQLDSKGIVIAKYKSTSEAEKATGIKGKTIAQAIRRNETAGGYHWKGEK